MGRKRATKTVTGEQTKDIRQRLIAWLNGHQRAWMLSVSLLFTVFSALSFDPKPFVGGDNASYVLLSRSLVQTGSLSDIWTPGAVPNTLYPFGFPVLLAPVSLLGLPYVWYKIIPFIAGLAGLWVVWSIFRRRDPVIAAAVVMLLAVNPHFVGYGHWVLSEMPFLLFSLIGLLFLRLWEERPRPMTFVLLILAAVFTNYIRNAGLALFAGVALHLLINKRYHAVAFFLTGCVALNVPWLMRNQAVGTGYGYFDWLLMRDPYQIELGRMTLGELLGRLGTNTGIYGQGIIPRMLFPTLDQWSFTNAGWVVCAVLGAPALTGWLIETFRNRSPEGWYVAVFLAMVLLWPTAWADVRLLLPLLPLLLFYTVQGSAHLIGKATGRNKPVLLLAVVTGLLVPTLSSSIGGWRQAVAVNKAYAAGDRLAGYDPAWRSFFGAARWVRHNTPQQAVVVSRKPSLFYLESERKTFCYPFTANRDSVVHEISKADYVMVEPVSGTAQRYLIPAIEPQLDKRFRIVYQAGSPPTYVLQVIKEDPDAKTK